MAGTEFTRHTSFPQGKCSFTGSKLWKMQVREWAWAQVDLNAVADSVGVDSNNPNPVPGRFAQGGKAISASRVTGTKKKLVKFYAEQRGFTLIFPFDGSDSKKIGNMLQVEVVDRRASSDATVSLTKLSGKTIAFNAHDTNSTYNMDKNVTFNKSELNPLTLFSAVDSDTNHIAISSHGGPPTPADKGDVDKRCMFVCGLKQTLLRLDLDNVEAAFGTLKSKVAKNAIIWIGGCTIGANGKFCQKAANASGCHVVAAGMVLREKKYPKGHVDILDRFCIPIVFAPNQPKMNVYDLCAKQETHKFTVPV
jgi:hypothetical protein